MPVCPNCHTEYRDDYTICSDCGAALVPDAPSGGKPRTKEEKRLHEKPADTIGDTADMLLANVMDPVELAYIISALADQGIPCRVLAGDVSQYLYILHGRSFMGTCVYVPEHALEPAYEVLVSYKTKPLPDDMPALATGDLPIRSFRFDLWTLRAYLILNFILFLFTGAF